MISGEDLNGLGPGLISRRAEYVSHGVPRKMAS